MALDDKSSFHAVKAMSRGEFCSTTITMSGVIGWCSTMSNMQSLHGLQPLACYLASENGAFGCLLVLDL
jgi:hypothetical protein